MEDHTQKSDMLGALTTPNFAMHLVLDIQFSIPPHFRTGNTMLSSMCWRPEIEIQDRSHMNNVFTKIY